MVGRGAQRDELVGFELGKTAPVLAGILQLVPFGVRYDHYLSELRCLPAQPLQPAQHSEALSIVLPPFFCTGDIGADL